MAYILAKFIRTMRPSKKLSERYLGPFPVTERVSFHYYLINLLEHLQAIHPVFYISQLELAPRSRILNHNNLSLPPLKLTATSNLKWYRFLILSGINTERTLSYTTYIGLVTRICQENISGSTQQTC